MAPRWSVTGVVLIVLGVLFLLAQRVEVGGEAVVAAIGIAFLAAYALTRQYGFLVPGGIMTGLGVGIIYENRLDGSGAPILLGLGVGFLAIYAVSSLRSRMPGNWWPLIPGTVLAFIGLMLAANATGALATIGRWWPAVLILIGLYVVLRRPGRPAP
jgi:hypothetical protein